MATRSQQAACLIGRRARRLREYDEAKNQERRASVEDGHASRPPAAHEAVCFRPVVTERLPVHVVFRSLFSSWSLRGGRFHPSFYSSKTQTDVNCVTLCEELETYVGLRG